jgi:hypothetical protein
MVEFVKPKSTPTYDAKVVVDHPCGPSGLLPDCLLETRQNHRR